MELKSVSYGSAVFFGVFTLVMYLILGIIQLTVLRQALLQVPEYASMASAITPVSALVVSPVIGGVIAYLFAIVAIFVYNGVAKKYPISWSVKK